MSSGWGKNIRVSVFGQSHSEAIGVVIDGLPAGRKLDMDAIDAFMQRRAPGKTPLSTARREPDRVRILSGLSGGRLCGAPLAAVIENKDIRPADYTAISDTPRPGHADYTAQVKYKGAQDSSGGGHFSGRLTAPLCIAGAVCLQLLEDEGVRVGAHIERIGEAADKRFDPVSVSPSDFKAVSENALPVIDGAAAEKMALLIEHVKSQGDSVGGIVECAIIDLPAGVGEPVFEGLENRISAAVFAIPAVRGIEFGAGFAGCLMPGSAHNDSYTVADGVIRTLTNNHGGILGGISSGMPVIFRTAFKPTPSIAKTQRTVSLSRMKQADITIGGRHDPCIVPRAVPCVEAAAAIAVYDSLLEYRKYL